MVHRLKGTGLPNVYLLDGIAVDQAGSRTTHTYTDLEGLYLALATAVALSPCAMTSAELRFLRKRLALSQDELGAIVEKRGQTVAKWEKGELPVPSSEATVIKLVWLGQHAPRELRTLAARAATGQRADSFDYVFALEAGRWTQDFVRGQIFASQRAREEAREVIRNAVSSSRAATVPITAFTVVRTAVGDASHSSSVGRTT